jgi:hypothetical protein
MHYAINKTTVSLLADTLAVIDGEGGRPRKLTICLSSLDSLSLAHACRSLQVVAAMTMYTKQSLKVSRPLVCGVSVANENLSVAPLFARTTPGSLAGYTQAHVDKTLKQRLEGNEQLLAGDLQGALKTYHLVLLALRGE